MRPGKGGDVTVVHLTGAPRERGRAHGEELREDIAEGLARWKESLVTARGEVDVDAYLGAFRSAIRFRAAIERWTPGLADEVDGIAEGAGADPDDVWAYQLMDEQWWFAERWRADGLGATPRHDRCSSLAVHEPGAPPIVAQNMDLPAVYDGNQVLLHITDSDVEALVFSAAGLIGFDGLNDHAVAVCCNSLPTLPVAEDGLPVAFVIRGVLAQRTRTGAVDLLRRVRHATGQNYVVGDRRGFADLECWQDDAVEWAMTNRCVLHTNHPLAVPGRVDEAPAGSTTHDRLATLRDRLGDRSDGTARAPADVGAVQELLATPPVSVPRTGDHAGMTLGSLVMELAEEPVLHLAPGPPATTPFAVHRFSRP